MTHDRGDCPTCRSTRTVAQGVCEVCAAELDGDRMPFSAALLWDLDLDEYLLAARASVAADDGPPTAQAVSLRRNSTVASPRRTAA